MCPLFLHAVARATETDLSNISIQCRGQECVELYLHCFQYVYTARCLVKHRDSLRCYLLNTALLVSET